MTGKRPTEASDGISSDFDIVVVPRNQEIVDEFDKNTVVGSRSGMNILLLSIHDPENPLWSRFVAERDSSFDLPIPFYERRIRRAKKKAARMAGILATNSYFVG
jgi:hypothetical protein